MAIIEKRLGERGFLNANLTILAAVLIITGFLGWQNWKLKQRLASPAPAASAPAEIPSAPAPQIAVTEPYVPAPVAPVNKKPSTTATTKRNYTQAPKKLPLPMPATMDEAPVTVARVTPTDVTPANVRPADVTPVEPFPFPRTESQVPAKPAMIRATIASGTLLTVRLLDTLNTDRNQSGDRFRASLEDPIISDGNVVLPRGTTVEGRVVEAEQAGRVKGVAQLAMELSQVQLAGGNTIVIETGTLRRQGETSTGSDAAKVGAGSAIGAIIGAIGGGGKGAGIGAATGAGAGTAGVLLTRGKPLVLTPETILSFQLNAPVTLEVAARRASDEASAQPERTAPAGDLDQDRPILRRRHSAQ